MPSSQNGFSVFNALWCEFLRVRFVYDVSDNNWTWRSPFYNICNCVLLSSAVFGNAPKSYLEIFGKLIFFFTVCKRNSFTATYRIFLSFQRFLSKSSPKSRELVSNRFKWVAVLKRTVKRFVLHLKATIIAYENNDSELNSELNVQKLKISKFHVKRKNS